MANITPLKYVRKYRDASGQRLHAYLWGGCVKGSCFWAFPADWDICTMRCI